MNWVDRKFRREDNLHNAEALWQESRAAIEDCCTTFNSRGPGRAQLMPYNGHSIRIEVQQEPPRPYQMDMTRRANITFDASVPEISVTLDAEPAKQFRIDADETHCFLKYHGKEITPDYFCELALHDAFFTQKPIPEPALQYAKTGNWI